MSAKKSSLRLLATAILLATLSACNYTRLEPDVTPSENGIEQTNNMTNNASTRQQSAAQGKVLNGTTTVDGLSTTGDKSGEVPEDLNVPPPDGGSSSGKGAGGTSSGGGSVTETTGKGSTGGSSTQGSTTESGTTGGTPTEIPPVVTAPVCGNGIRESKEACDDANLLAGDGCSPSCGIEPGFSCPDETYGVSHCINRETGLSVTPSGTGSSTGKETPLRTGGASATGKDTATTGPASTTGGDPIAPKGTTTGVEIPLITVDEGDSSGGSKGTTTGTSKGTTTGVEIPLFTVDEGDSSGGSKGTTTGTSKGDTTGDASGGKGGGTGSSYKLMYVVNDSTGYNIKVSHVNIGDGLNPTLHVANLQGGAGGSSLLPASTRVRIARPAASQDNQYIAYDSIQPSHEKRLSIMSMTPNGMSGYVEFPTVSLNTEIIPNPGYPSWRNNRLFYVSENTPLMIGEVSVMGSGNFIAMHGGSVILRSDRPRDLYGLTSFYQSTFAYEGLFEGTSYIYVMDPRCNDATLNPFNVCQVTIEGDSFAPLAGFRPSLASVDGQLMLVFDRMANARLQVFMCGLNFVPGVTEGAARPPIFSCDDLVPLTVEGDNHSARFTGDGKFIFYVSERGAENSVYVTQSDSLSGWHRAIASAPGINYSDPSVFPLNPGADETPSVTGSGGDGGKGVTTGSSTKGGSSGGEATGAKTYELIDDSGGKDIPTTSGGSSTGSSTKGATTTTPTPTTTPKGSTTGSGK